MILAIVLGSMQSNAQDSLDRLVLENFDQADHLEWFIVNDGVMGGLSSSRIEVQEDRLANFTGNLSLENYGGFASTRALLKAPVRPDFGRLSIRVQGDGNKYQFRCRTNNGFDGVSYVSTFQTVEGEWTEHTFEMADFTPQFRGRQVNAPPLRPDEIRQIGFLIADKQEGKFKLVIDQISALPAIQKS